VLEVRQTDVGGCVRARLHRDDDDDDDDETMRSTRGLTRAHTDDA
jgi:hypothetical protein